MTEMLAPVAAAENPWTAAQQQFADPAGAGDRTLVQLFREQVAARGASPAMYRKVEGRWVAITWYEYASAARRLASFLLSIGLGEAQHVAIWSFNRPEFIIAS